MTKKIEYEKYLLPGIIPYIETTLASLDLMPEIPPQTFIEQTMGKKHRYASVATKSSGERVLFFARLHNNEDARRKFLQDALFLKKINEKNNRLATYVPSIYESCLIKNKEWFTREHIQCPPLGNVYLAEQKLTPSDINNFLPLFDALMKIPRPKGHSLERRGADFFRLIAEGNLHHIGSLYSPKEKTNIKNFLRSKYPTIQKNAQYIVHGDCHPGNILYGDSCITLIDWETVHINMREMDVAYFFVSLSADTSFRRSFLEAHYRRRGRKNEFRELFPIAVVFYSLNYLYRLLYGRKRHLTSTKRSQVATFAKKLALAAIQGYEKCVKI